MKNKVLITGGAGYLGSVLTQELLNHDYNVTVLDNLSYKQTSLLHVCNDRNFNFIKGDVTDKALLQSLVYKADIIIPLAAIVGAPACDANKELATAINFTQIKNIVDILTDDQKILMPNTNSQYGSSSEVITEDSPFNPLSHYAVTKCNAEDYIMKNTHGICLRLATVFGASPRMRTDLLVNDFVYKAMTDGVLVLFQSKFKRNYIHVRDIAQTFLYCIVIIENEFSTDFDNRNYIVSNDKLESTGWSPKFSISDGITELTQAYKMVINDNNKKYTNL